jgi:hypothetical protein
MDVPSPPQAVAALAAFVRDRLAEVSDLWTGRDGSVEILRGPGRQADSAVRGAARQLAIVLVGASAPFATTSYARARLIRQMHATGLLSDEQAVRAQRVLDLEPDSGGRDAPR